MSPDQFIEKLLQTPTGKITACNVLAGLRLGLYDRKTVCAVLYWWAKVVQEGPPGVDQGYQAGEIHNALNLLKEKQTSGRLTEIVDDPVYECPELHIFCRRPIESPSEFVATVKPTHILKKIIDKDVLERLKEDIDFEKPAENMGSSHFLLQLETVKATLKSTESLTDPKLGIQGILWFTPNDSLLNALEGCAPEKRADAVKDKLGLVHYGEDKAVSVVILPSTVAEERPDCGQPTFVDAGDHSRFRCAWGQEGVGDGWGATINLAPLAEDRLEPGLPERVCGQVPMESDTAPLELQLIISDASPNVRGYFAKVNDAAYAKLLAGQEEALAGGAPLKDQMLDLCAGAW